MTWEIMLGIITLVTFVFSIGKIVSNNTEALTEVKCSIDDLRSAFSDQKNEVKELKSTCGNHETRITVLEKK